MGRGLDGANHRSSQSSFFEPVQAGEPYVVAARLTGVEGNRRHAESALLAPGGRAVAVARATWIVVPSPEAIAPLGGV